MAAAEEAVHDKKDVESVDEAPSRSTDLSKTLPEEAFNHFVQGKRHMLVHDYNFAVQSLSTACELYAQHFGELALECAEVQFLYGKALFRLSQQQSGVLGGALSEEVSNEDDEEDEQGKSSEAESKENESDKEGSDVENEEEMPEEGDAPAEGEEEEKEPSESTDSPQPITEAAEESKENVEPTPPDTAAEKPAEQNETSTSEEKQEAEEDDLELAWNSLETAKSIYLRQVDNVEAKLKVAEILQLLAEISMESDNNMAAIVDLEESLKIKKEHLKPDDRLLAETYYQMGLAQMLEKMYTSALVNFNTTMDILKLRIENLKTTPVNEEPGSFEKADVEKEIEDLESVLADIKEKIEDTQDLIADAKKVIDESISKKEVESSTKTEGFSEMTKGASNSKPVSNITHLLKRKKPGQDEDSDRSSKRPKTSTSVQNGEKAVAE